MWILILKPPSHTIPQSSIESDPNFLAIYPATASYKTSVIIGSRFTLHHRVPINQARARGYWPVGIRNAFPGLLFPHLLIVTLPKAQFLYNSDALAPLSIRKADKIKDQKSASCAVHRYNHPFEQEWTRTPEIDPYNILLQCEERNIGFIKGIRLALDTEYMVERDFPHLIVCTTNIQEG